jgi:hypothetical protein
MGVLAMGVFSCWHKWAVPRRWPEFEGKRNVDVQTCSKCGARRESPVRFGRFAPPPADPTPARQFAEVRA